MNDIYKDIALRTGGDIMIGVVGPVRSGKSTFIGKFMEKLVIPNIAGKNKRQIAVDELPQSAQGKTVMTTEPKFVPAEAVTVKLDKAQAKIRLIDCVGYMVDGAIGHEEDGKERLVKTPWQDEEMPFEKAAEYGTKKVIGEHSTIGVVVTCDGSFTDIPREAYIAAEERVVGELMALNKPFIVIFNTTAPDSEKVKKECAQLRKKYGVAVLPTDVTKLDKEGLADILEQVLFEFPMKVLNVDLPDWVTALPPDNEIIKNTIELIKQAAGKVDKMSSYKAVEEAFSLSPYFDGAEQVDLDMGEGGATVRFAAKPDLFYKVLSAECGEEIAGEFDTLNLTRSLKKAKEEYEKLKDALEKAYATGYGIVPTRIEQATVEKARIVKKGGQYCVKMRVFADSLHLIQADVNCETEVISGSKEQCENFIAMLEGEGGEGLETKVFGTPVINMLEENLSRKCEGLNDNVKQKLKRTLNKAVNEKRNNLICLLI